nr:uncharacterized protein LOC133571794 [Nerophis lumbriciformis]
MADKNIVVSPELVEDDGEIENENVPNHHLESNKGVERDSQFFNPLQQALCHVESNNQAECDSNFFHSSHTAIYHSNWKSNYNPSLQDTHNGLNLNTNTDAHTQPQQQGDLEGEGVQPQGGMVGVQQQRTAHDHPNLNETQRGEGLNVLRREVFNNVELKSVLPFPQNSGVTDYATFYRRVMGNLENLTNRVVEEARPNDIVQLEFIGDRARKHASFTFQNDGGEVMNAFQNVLDLLVQSNAEIMNDDEIQVVVQVIHNPRGGVRRKAETLLEHELYKKKARYLYKPNNVNNHLCFAISLAHLIHPEFTDSQAVLEAKQIQRKAGLDDQTPVTFSHIHAFEKVVRRKIVILYREEDQRPFSLFETDSPKSDNPLYLYLSQNHYNGIINIKGFLSKPHVCHYCYRGYIKANRHKCDGHCVVCTIPDCVKIMTKSVFCQDCNMWARTPTLCRGVKFSVLKTVILG